MNLYCFTKTRSGKTTSDRSRPQGFFKLHIERSKRRGTYFLSKVDNYLPKLQPIADAYSASLKDIKTEMKSSPDNSNFVDYANKHENIVRNLTMKAMEVLSAAYEGVAIAASRKTCR